MDKKNRKRKKKRRGAKAREEMGTREEDMITVNIGKRRRALEGERHESRAKLRRKCEIESDSEHKTVSVKLLLTLDKRGNCGLREGNRGEDEKESKWKQR